MIKVGDVVAIRGDLRKNYKGECQYLPEQLVDGKFLKRYGTDEVWTGIVSEVKGDMVKVAGGWRGVEMCVSVVVVNTTNGLALKFEENQ